MADADLGGEIAERVRAAAATRTPLCLRGAGTKDFYGRPPTGAPLALSGHRGILVHEPSELVLTARAGTPVAEIERQLDAAGQMLGFEPPAYEGLATIGGTIAAGFAGPRRMQAGAPRDFLLGVRIVDGSGQVLRFGGQVMKNVAGYDVSRLMAGSLGTLGVLLEVTLKLLPRPRAECTLAQACSADESLARLRRWHAQPLPISASLWHDGVLHLRLSGAAAAVAAAAARLGGERVDEGAARALWRSVREQQHAFFRTHETLWRLALPPTAPPLPLAADTLIEWQGAQRWLGGEHDAAQLRALVHAAGGHATLYRASPAQRRAIEPFTPPAPALVALQRRVKAALDPQGVLNPGRLHVDF